MQPGINCDSIGHCDLYSNPYDATLQSHPALVRQRQVLYIKAQDSLTSRQLRMEKEIFIRILKGNLFFSHLSVVQQISKFIFLALMLPPYMLIYGIPKWVCIALFPKLYQLVFGVLKKFFNQFTKLSVRIITPFFQKIINLINPVFNFLKKINLHLTKLKKTFITTFFQPLKKSLSKIIQILRNFKNIIIDCKQKVRRFFIYLPNNVAEKFLEIYEALQRKIIESIPYFARLFSPMKQWIRAKGEALNRFISNLIKNKIYPHVLRYIYQPIKKSIKFVNHSRILVKRKLEKFSTPVLYWTKLKCVRFKEMIEKRWETFINFANPIRYQSQFMMQRLAQKLTRLGNLAREKIKTNLLRYPLQWAVFPVFSLFSSQSFKSLKSQFNYRKIRALWQSLMVVQKNMYSGTKRAFKRLKQGLFKSLKTAKKSSSYLFTFSALLFQFFKKILKMILVICQSSFLIFRLMLAWIRVLFRYGMVLVGEKTKQFLFLPSPFKSPF